MTTRLPQFDCEGFARGWFVVSFSEELAVGDVKPMQYFGKHLVLFRTESGSPKILDAHCPHMGAHLADNEAYKDPDLKSAHAHYAGIWRRRKELKELTMSPSAAYNAICGMHPELKL